MKTRRLNRIFRPNGRVLVVAMEHSLIFGPGKGLERPGDTIRKVIAGGADAVMTSFGIAQHFARELAPVGLILRADGASTKLGPDESAPVWFGVKEALRLGADALCVSAFPGDLTEIDTFSNLAEVAREARAWNLPLQAEMVPGGMGSAPEHRTVEDVALAARVGIELGGDWVKIPYVDGFEHVTAVCFKPVVIMGGSKRGTEVGFLKEIRSAMDAGASGGTIGRNIFECDDPEAMTAAIVAIIHHDATVDEAVAILRRRC
jgi:class I fructose-bisphosphate aldolase/fructose-bisphosphate aldolase/2-amino-3,7-dideoxy-D-threo-hept-6-ulosonate synthase